MNNQPLRIYYETKLPYYIVTVLLVVGFLIGFLIIGSADYLMNPCFYLLCVSICFFLFVCIYRISEFSIYQDKLVWKKGSHSMESPWSDVTGIHYDFRWNRFRFKFVKSSDFFLETKKGFTKYANEHNIRQRGIRSYGSKSKELIADIKQFSGVTEDVGAVSGLKQRQNLWVMVILISAIVLLCGGGLWYANYQFQQEMNSVPNTIPTP